MLKLSVNEMFMSHIKSSVYYLYCPVTRTAVEQYRNAESRLGMVRIYHSMPTEYLGLKGTR